MSKLRDAGVVYARASPWHLIPHFATIVKIAFQDFLCLADPKYMAALIQIAKSWHSGYPIDNFEQVSCVFANFYGY